MYECLTFIPPANVSRRECVAVIASLGGEDEFALITDLLIKPFYIGELNAKSNLQLKNRRRPFPNKKNQEQPPTYNK